MKRYFYLFISIFISALTAGAQGFPEDGGISHNQHCQG